VVNPVEEKKVEKPIEEEEKPRKEKESTDQLRQEEKPLEKDLKDAKPDVEIIQARDGENSQKAETLIEDYTSQPAVVSP